MQTALKLFGVSINEARVQAKKLVSEIDKKHGSEVPTAFQPSLLRRYPLISFGKANERLRAPLPQLILLRITAGIYYDLVGGPSKLRNEAADRFEQYCANFTSASLPKFEVTRSHTYNLQGNKVHSPDILVKREGKVILAIECKATKLTFGAQFAEDPVAEAKVGFDEIAKGVFQLWRYFSHARRGLIGEHTVATDCYGIVLTLDLWLMISPGMRKQVIEAATKLADDEVDITAEDRRQVDFCWISDFEQLLTMADEELLLKTLSAAREEKFTGWILPSICKEIEKTKRNRKQYPFDVGDVLPWWKAVDELEARQSPALTEKPDEKLES
jgi:hypothetical protein